MDRLNKEEIDELLLYTCKEKYFYLLKESDFNNSEFNSNHDNNYCIGPRTLIECSSIINTWLEMENDGNSNGMRNIECPMCLEFVIGIGYACTAQNNCTCCMHAKCVEQLTMKECPLCRTHLERNAMLDIRLLRNPSRAEDIIGQVFDDVVGSAADVSVQPNGNQSQTLQLVTSVEMNAEMDVDE